MKKNSIIIFTVIVLMLVSCEQQTSLDNPAPVGEPRNVGRDVTLTILDVILPANNMIDNSITNNNTLEPYSEYAIIKLRIQCNQPADMTCSFSSYSIDIADQDGSIYMKAQDEYIKTTQLVTGSIPDELEPSVYLSGGSTLESNVVLLISKDVNYSTIVYTELYGSSTYFAMP